MIFKTLLLFIIVVISFFVSALLGWGSLEAIYISIALFGLIFVGSLCFNALSNSICRAWAYNRNPLLSYLIVKKQWIATSPLKVKILTALKTQQLESILSEGRKGVAILLEALNDHEPLIVNQAKLSLHRLQNSEGINYLCQQWQETRETFLGDIILQSNYQATSPLKVKILTALKTNQLESILSEGRKGVAILLEALNDHEPLIVNQAKLSLHRLQNSEGIN
ncbi:MAG: hypothetical protein MK105_19265, partial [Crocinitomicaceae bacterium]|nr:hypothetical protein [Crocinitomicaceae bacterium]